MATPRQSEVHQQGQEGLVSLIPALLREAWPLLDVHNLKASLPKFQAVVKAIVVHYGRASAAAALDYYRSERRDAGVPGRVLLKMPAEPADSVIESAVQWAVSDLYGPVSPEVEASAQEKLTASVERLVLDQSRTAIIDATQSDAAAKGWVRITEPGACSFCLMLAVRSATYAMYESKRSAGQASNYKRRAGGRTFTNHPDKPSDFKVHDHCRCHVEPVFGQYEPTAAVREASQLWDEATKGRSGNDARVAFRQAVEGRPVTGKPTKNRKGETVRNGGAAKALSDHDAAWFDKQIALTKSLKPSAWRTQQLKRLRAERAKH